MLDAARQAIAFAQHETRDGLEKNQMLVLSLVRLIEIIGEAASQVTPSTRREYPQIPWPLIVAMRNRLIHAYFDVDIDRVWETIKDDLPPLISALEQVIASQ